MAGGWKSITMNLLLLVVGAALCVLALQQVIAGIQLAGTPVWGYNDSMPWLYMTVGGVSVLFGALLFFGGILLLRHSFDGLFQRPDSAALRSKMLLALGLTLAMLSVAAFGWALAANVVTPDETADRGVVGITTMGTTVAAVLLGVAAAAVLRSLGRRDGPATSITGPS